MPYQLLNSYSLPDDIDIDLYLERNGFPSRPTHHYYQGQGPKHGEMIYEKGELDRHFQHHRKHPHEYSPNTRVSNLPRSKTYELETIVRDSDKIAVIQVLMPDDTATQIKSNYKLFEVFTK